MKILMVHSVYATTLSYSHALASLAGSISRAFPSTAIEILTLHSHDTSAIAAEILDHEPDLILFTAMSNQWRLICEIAVAVRLQDASPCLIAGGIHLTARPDTARSGPFDVTVVGEGEAAIIDLLQCSDSLRGPEPRQIRAETLADLDALPLPRIDLFPINEVTAYPSVMFSRGCPFSCRYCMSRDGGLGNQVRWKSPERAVAEIESLLRYCDPPTVFIDDDTLLKNPRWLSAFSSLYTARVSRPYCCNARPETVRESTVKDLVASGCDALGIGIESGSERIRAILGRPMSDDVILRAFRCAKQAGLRTWSFNMVGTPGETVDDLRRTIAINEEAGTDFVRVSIFTPYPGSPLGDGVEVGQQGYFKSPDSLPDDMRIVYKEWIRALRSAGRLWLTESEQSLIL